MSNWFRKKALEPGQVRYRALFPIDVYIQTSGDPEKDREIVYGIINRALETNPNIESGFLSLSDITPYNDIAKEEGIDF